MRIPLEGRLQSRKWLRVLPPLSTRGGQAAQEGEACLAQGLTQCPSRAGDALQDVLKTARELSPLAHIFWRGKPGTLCTPSSFQKRRIGMPQLGLLNSSG